MTTKVIILLACEIIFLFASKLEILHRFLYQAKSAYKNHVNLSQQHQKTLILGQLAGFQVTREKYL